MRKPRYETPEQLAEAIEWEGGICEFLFSYGMSIDDLPEDTPDVVIIAFLSLMSQAKYIELIKDWLPEV